MSTNGDPLTLRTNFSNSSNDRERNHFSNCKTVGSYPQNSIASSKTKRSTSTAVPTPTPASSFLGQFTGYATSEDDHEEPHQVYKFNQKKIPRSKKPASTYKSADIVASDSGSEAELDKTPRQQLSSQPSATTTHRQRKDISKRQLGTIKDISSCKSASRATGYNAQKSSSRKTLSTRAPTPQTIERPRTNNMEGKRQSTMAKRSKMSGPFVMDSDESEANEDNGHANNWWNNNSVRAAPFHKVQSPQSDPPGVEKDIKILPIKQLNKSRLNKLLGRSKPSSPITDPQRTGLVSGARPASSADDIDIGKSASFVGSRPLSSPSNRAKTDFSPTRNLIQDVQIHAAATVSSIARRSTQGSPKNVRREEIVKRSPDQAAKPLATKSTIGDVAPIRSGRRVSKQQHQKLLVDAPLSHGQANSKPGKVDSQVAGPRSFLMATLSDAKGGTIAPFPVPQPHDARTKSHVIGGGSSPPSLPKAHEHRYGRQPPKGTSMTSIKGDLGSSPTAKSIQPPKKLSSVKVKSNSAFPAGKVQPLSIEDSLALGTGVICPQTQSARTPKSTLAPSLDLLQSQKRKAGDIAGRSDLDDRPMKKKSTIPLQSSSTPQHNSSEKRTTQSSATSSRVSHVTGLKTITRTPKTLAVSRPTNSTDLLRSGSLTRPSTSIGARQSSIQKLSPPLASSSNKQAASNTCRSPLLSTSIDNGHTPESRRLDPPQQAPLDPSGVCIRPPSDALSIASEKTAIQAPKKHCQSTASTPENIQPKLPSIVAATMDESRCEDSILHLRGQMEQREDNIRGAESLEVGGPVVNEETTFSKSHDLTTSEISSSDGTKGTATATYQVFDVLNLSSIPTVSSDAESYFEYSVREKEWTDKQSECDVVDTEITVCPLTSIYDANAQSERMFHTLREQNIKFAQMDLSESRTQHDGYGCSTYTATFSPLDYPARKLHLKIWVQRDYVSKLANRAPASLKRTSFISRTAYTLRLFKLIHSHESSDSEDSEKTHPTVRAYHPIMRPEVYTTIDAANRAARNLQVELSHEIEPKDEITKKWQVQRLRDLNVKLRALDPIMDGPEGYWKSEFNGCGMGGDRFELVVEQVSICGPRNL